MTQPQNEAQKISTCLWFDDAAEEAATLYTSLIPDSAITSSFSPDPQQPPLLVEFTLAGVPYQGLNGGPQFPQSEAVSIVVHTEDQVETDRLWDALLANGGSESQCGWLKDRFGLSWQIVPRRFMELLSDPDRVAAGRAMAAMMQMRKLDIAALEAAFNGA
jgi:predicted 3-demethylubiquinone-9 3-methyltransferase (glyoxalase superfamily)